MFKIIEQSSDRFKTAKDVSVTALAKALRSVIGRRNFEVVRPSITYGKVKAPRLKISITLPFEEKGK